MELKLKKSAIIVTETERKAIGEFVKIMESEEFEDLDYDDVYDLLTGIAKGELDEESWVSESYTVEIVPDTMPDSSNENVSMEAISSVLKRAKKVLTSIEDETDCDEDY